MNLEELQQGLIDLINSGDPVFANAAQPENYNLAMDAEERELNEWYSGL